MTSQVYTQSRALNITPFRLNLVNIALLHTQYRECYVSLLCGTCLVLNVSSLAYGLI